MYYKMIEYPGLSFVAQTNAILSEMPYIYFCCHPQDHVIYFDKITLEIFGCQKNVVIWFLENPLEMIDDETIAKDIWKMQLIVAPITSRFLNEENRARCIEFRIALEKHIPVLPLLQERGLENDFNKKCGAIHCLSKCVISGSLYERMFRKFLSTTLFDEGTMQEIKEEFRARVFLSYRKEDRKYVSDTTKFLHHFEFMRDVAIWYDDYIAPGEKFDSVILNTIEKCEIFVLLVTPNLLEDGNYVMNIEYPFARMKGKAIVPIEVVSTDYSELKKKYRNIPQCISIDDYKGLYEMLENLSSKWRTLSQKEIPMHLYKMGLAYLKGINVEIDYGQALSLIEEAAKNQVPEAYEKIIFMYEHGEGVRINYKKAVYWQKQFLEYIKKNEALCQCGEFDNKREYVFQKFHELCHLGDFYWALKQYQKAIFIYKDAEAIIFDWINYSTNAYAYHIPQAKSHLSDVCLKLGQMYVTLEEFKEAEKYYLRALAIDRELDENSVTSSRLSMRNLAITLTVYGELCLNKGEILRAESLLIEAEFLLNQLINGIFWMEPKKNAKQVYSSCENDEENIYIHIGLGDVYLGLAKVAILKSEFEIAGVYYKKAINNFYCLLINTPDNEELMQNFNISMESLGALIKLSEEMIPSSVESGLIIQKLLEAVDEIESFFGKLDGEILLEYTAISLDVYKNINNKNL